MARCEDTEKINAMAGEIYTYLRSDAMSRAMASLLYGKGYIKRDELSAYIEHDIVSVLEEADGLDEKVRKHLIGKVRAILDEYADLSINID